MGNTDQRWYAFRNLVRARDYAAAQKLLDADKALLDLRNQTGETGCGCPSASTLT